MTLDPAPGPWDEPRTLLGWLKEPRADRGLRVFDGDWQRHDYATLASLVYGTAELLRSEGIGAGDVVSVVASDPIRLASGFFGALQAGATPLLLPSPTVLGARYVDHVAPLLVAGRPRVVLTTDEFHASLSEAVARAGASAGCPVVTAQPTAEAGTPRASGSVALLQFTSGSTGQPRPVRVSWDNLETNVSTIRRWLHLTPDESVASWLPLYHDMGLIGCFITGICSEMNAWIMRPEQFVMRPIRWLECFGLHGVTITAAPTFGYAYVNRRIRSDMLDGHDYSRWRVAIAGAERLDGPTMRQFAELLAPAGFQPSTFCPAYGLAEATLAVTGVAPEADTFCVAIESERMALGDEVTVTSRLPLMADASTPTLVSCGRPLYSQEVSVVDNHGRLLPDGMLGEIVVEGDCVTIGYADASVGASRIEAGRLRTGDAGFLLEGELFVFGRILDSFKVHGRQVYAEDVEATVGRAVTAASRCVVVASRRAGLDEVVAVVEAAEGQWTEEVLLCLRTVVGASMPVAVYTARRNAIPRTTSGKPRRSLLWSRLQAGELDAVRVAEWSPAAVADDDSAAAVRREGHVEHDAAVEP